MVIFILFFPQFCSQLDQPQPTSSLHLSVQHRCFRLENVASHSQETSFPFVFVCAWCWISFLVYIYSCLFNFGCSKLEDFSSYSQEMSNLILVCGLIALNAPVPDILPLGYFLAYSSVQKYLQTLHIVHIKTKTVICFCWSVRSIGLNANSFYKSCTFVYSCSLFSECVVHNFYVKSSYITYCMH